MVSDRRTAAFSLIASGTLALVASIGLSVTFGWPDVLDAPADEVLPAFAEIAATVQTLFLLQMAGSLVLDPRRHRAPPAARPQPRHGRRPPDRDRVRRARPGDPEPRLDPLAARRPRPRRALPRPVRVHRDHRGHRRHLRAGQRLRGRRPRQNLGWLLQGVWAVGLAVLAWRAADVAPTWLRRTLAVVAVAWTVTLVPAGWLASDVLTSLGSTVYSVWYLGLLVLGVTLLRDPSDTPATLVATSHSRPGTPRPSSRG